MSIHKATWFNLASWSLLWLVFSVVICLGVFVESAHAAEPLVMSVTPESLTIDLDERKDANTTDSVVIKFSVEHIGTLDPNDIEREITKWDCNNCSQYPPVTISAESVLKTKEVKISSLINGSNVTTKKAIYNISLEKDVTFSPEALYAHAVGSNSTGGTIIITFEFLAEAKTFVYDDGVIKQSTFSPHSKTFSHTITLKKKSGPAPGNVDCECQLQQIEKPGDTPKEQIIFTAKVSSLEACRQERDKKIQALLKDDTELQKTIQLKDSTVILACTGLDPVTKEAMQSITGKTGKTKETTSEKSSEKTINKTPISFSLPDASVLNPLGTTSPTEVLGRILSIIFGILGTIALVMFVFAGILWMTAIGQSEQVDKAKKILIWSSFGILLILGSYGIVSFVLQAFT